MKDLVIIGGGIIGGASLYHLLKNGYNGNVLLLEKDDALAQQSTSLSAGGIRNIWSTEVNMKMTTFSIEQFSRFKEIFGRSIGFERNGYLFTYYADEWEDIVNFKENWDRAGVNVELKEPGEIEKMIPGLKTGVEHLDSEILDILSISPIAGGLYGEDCAIINATSAAQAYFDYSKEKYKDQVEIRLKTEVENIVIEDGEIKGIKTTEGDEINCGAILLAAGAWSRKILDNSDIPEEKSIPVSPVKRMLFVVSQPGSGDYENIPLTIIDNGVYFRPEAENLIVGRADEEQPPGFDTKPERSYYEDLVNLYLQARIEGAEYCRIENMWGGLYAVNTADHNALIGEHPEYENLYLCTGFSGHGIMEAPAAGLTISEIIENGEIKTIPEAEVLNPTRIRKGNFVTETIVI